MKTGLHVGSIGELTWVVDPTMTITLGGLPEATVFSTPNMIMLMERAAREALRPFLDDSEESVGIDVQIEHVGAASLGSVVHGTACVTSIDGNKIAFEVRAFNEDREIGRGNHRRAVIQIARFVDRLQKERQVDLTKLSPTVLGNPNRNDQSMESKRMNLQLQNGNLVGTQTIDVSIQRQMATVTLNRPKSLNAVNLQMTSDLEAVIDWIGKHPQEVRVVVLTGAGEAFCAGDDVKEVATLSIDEARQLSIRQARMFLAFEHLPQPVIAAVNGVAFGAGCVAAYSADFRIASHSSQFAMPEIRLGWPPGYGVAQLTALVGKARAMQLCLLGEPIPASIALEWGLVHEVVSTAQLMSRANAIAGSLMKLPAEAIRRTKKLIHADEGSLPKVTHLADTEAYIRCLELPDAREGIEAFVQKRKPRFKGM